MRVMMHIIPHIAIIGLIIFFCLISYKKRMEWITYRGGEFDGDNLVIIFGVYACFSWIPSVLIECLLY